MTIHHTLSDGMFGAKTQEELKAKAEEFLRSKGVDAHVELDGTDGISFETGVDPEDFERVSEKAQSLCRAHQFGKAKQVLDAALALHPLHSETYRLYAQVLMEQGRPDDAVASCIDALRLDPKNEWALLLMGNLYARDKKEPETGATFFRKALAVNPGNVFASINLGAILMGAGKADEAEPLFRKAVELDPGNLNALCGLCTVLNARGAWRDTFDLLSDALPKWEDRPEDTNAPVLRARAADLMTAAARELCKGPEFEEAVRAMQREVEEKGGVPVRIERNPAESYPSRLELARNYKRDYHRIVYNEETVPWGAVAHQLECLSLWIDGDKAYKNEAVLDDGRGWQTFKDTFVPHLQRTKPDIPFSKVVDLARTLHRNVVSQVMNTPLDLVVNEHLFRERPALRSQQFLTMTAMVGQASQAVKFAATDPAFPGKVVSISRTLDLVAALQLRHLFGQDLAALFDATAEERRQADELYTRFLTIDTNYQPGDQFQLVRAYADALGAKAWFSVGPEKEYVLEPTAEEVSEEEDRRRKQEKFKKAHAEGSDPAVTAMMSMYMAGALEAYDSMPFDKVREIAQQFAMLGMNGIDPNKRSGYAVPGLPGKDMSGYEALAFYYVSFARAFPEVLPQLGLPFAGAYENAKKIHEARKG